MIKMRLANTNICECRSI